MVWRPITSPPESTGYAPDSPRPWRWMNVNGGLKPLATLLWESTYYACTNPPVGGSRTFHYTQSHVYELEILEWPSWPGWGEEVAIDSSECGECHRDGYDGGEHSKQLLSKSLLDISVRTVAHPRGNIEYVSEQRARGREECVVYLLQPQHWRITAPRGTWRRSRRYWWACTQRLPVEWRCKLHVEDFWSNNKHVYNTALLTRILFNSSKVFQIQQVSPVSGK